MLTTIEKVLKKTYFGGCYIVLMIINDIVDC